VMPVQGALLCGPPGIGKTYSIRALTQLYSGLCDFKLYTVSIPSLLADGEQGLQ
jgi:SpoVK/Ycf46/Vps4 family AAA+-type ATPase